VPVVGGTKTQALGPQKTKKQERRCSFTRINGVV
jgi:hypothetical protein